MKDVIRVLSPVICMVVNKAKSGSPSILVIQTHRQNVLKTFQPVEKVLTKLISKEKRRVS